MVEFTTKPMVDKLKEMFEILDKIGIILPRCGVIPSNPYIWGISIVVD